MQARPGLEKALHAGRRIEEGAASVPGTDVPAYIQEHVDIPTAYAYGQSQLWFCVVLHTAKTGFGLE